LHVSVLTIDSDSRYKTIPKRVKTAKSNDRYAQTLLEEKNSAHQKTKTTRTLSVQNNTNTKQGAVPKLNSSTPPFLTKQPSK
jgi:hypothetical protein